MDKIKEAKVRLLHSMGEGIGKRFASIYPIRVVYPIRSNSIGRERETVFEKKNSPLNDDLIEELATW